MAAATRMGGKAVPYRTRALAVSCVVDSRDKLGEGAFFGSGARVLPGVRVGRGCVIGAGAVVVRSAPDGTTLYAAPAKRL